MYLDFVYEWLVCINVAHVCWCPQKPGDGLPSTPGTRANHAVSRLIVSAKTEPGSPLEEQQWWDQGWELPCLTLYPLPPLSLCCGYKPV